MQLDQPFCFDHFYNAKLIISLYSQDKISLIRQFSYHVYTCVNIFHHIRLNCFCNLQLALPYICRWGKTHALLIEGGLNYGAIKSSVAQSRIAFRDGVTELFELLEVDMTITCTAYLNFVWFNIVTGC